MKTLLFLIASILVLTKNACTDTQCAEYPTADNQYDKCNANKYDPILNGQCPGCVDAYPNCDIC